MSAICSRFTFNEVFDIYSDLYISFETSSPIEEYSGLVVSINDASITEDISGIRNYLAGEGLGVLYTKTQALQPTGHQISVAVDGFGYYGMADTFAGAGTLGNTDRVPFSITTRASRSNIPFKHLNSSSTLDVLENSIPTAYRFRFKGFLNKVYVDILDNDTYEYKNIYSIDTNVNINDISNRYCRVMFSYFGLHSNFNIKDITYSGIKI